MRIRSQLSLAIATALLAFPSVSLAQGSTGELREAPYRHRIAGELGFYHRGMTGGSLVALQPAIHASFGLLQQEGETPIGLQLDLDWRGAGYVADSDFGDDSAAFRVFNPYAGVRIGHEEHDLESSWRVRGGLGITLPLANAYDPDDEVFTTLVLGAALTGGWDPWLSSIGSMAVVLRGDFEYRHTYFLAGAETALGLMLPVEYQGFTGDTVVAPQLGVWAAGRPIEQLAIGMRFQAVALVRTGDTAFGMSNTEGYLALVPFVRLELGAGFLETRLVANLDDPFGPAFDEGGFWGWYIGGGASF